MQTSYVLRGTGRRMERRRHTRFDTARSDSKAGLIVRSGLRLEFRECSLRNISYGGMCIEGDLPCKPGEAADFLLDLETPLQDLVLVKARIEWERAEGHGRRLFGARFLESSKGWLAGPEERTIQ